MIGLGENYLSIFNIYIYIWAILYYYFLPFEFFTPTFTIGLSLESE